MSAIQLTIGIYLGFIVFLKNTKSYATCNEIVKKTVQLSIQ